jgi:multidrug resistance efflux pump
VRQAFERRQELHKRALIPKQQLDDAEAALQAKQAGYESSLQSAKNLRASIQAPKRPRSWPIASCATPTFARRSTASSKSAWSTWASS